jgi:2,3-bisphosphoglycerate-dependent phosphoglycerate mutase
VLTNIYMVRHAQSDTRIREDAIRPLTPKGLVDAKRVSETLIGMNISKIFSSPYLRTVQTVQHFAESQMLSISQMDDFRERAVGGWVDDFQVFSRQQWEDFTFKLEGGESLSEVQERNIKALLELKKENEGLNIVVGTHGTALGTIINYYDTRFGYEHFWSIVDRMPYIMHFQYQDEDLVSMQEIEVD